MFQSAAGFADVFSYFTANTSECLVINGHEIAIEGFRLE